MVDIPEQAVKAAIRGYASSKQHTFDGQIHDALTAAAPYMSGVKVKQLEWVNAGLIHRSNLYEIEDMGPNWSNDRYQLWYNREVLQGVFGTLDEARSAAQEDFDDNVLECIVGGVDVAAVRRQALEEAATLIDEGFDKVVGKSWRKDGKPSKNDSCPHDKFMYEDCEKCASAAIRALSAEPAQGNTKPVDVAAERAQALKEAETQENLKQWNIQDHLKTPGSIAEYLQATLDEGDSDLLINAVSDVIRALKSQPVQTGGGDDNS